MMMTSATNFAGSLNNSVEPVEYSLYCMVPLITNQYVGRIKLYRNVELPTCFQLRNKIINYLEGYNI